MARGTKDSDATTVAQLKGALERLGGGATVDATGRVTAPQYVLSGTTYDNVGTALVALDSAVVTTKTDVDTLGSQLNRLFQEETGAKSDGAGRLALGGTHGMVLGNVADGRIAAGSRDAVNGGQLHATNQKVGENRSEISDLRAALDGMQPRAERSLMAEGGPVVGCSSRSGTTMKALKHGPGCLASRWATPRRLPLIQKARLHSAALQ